MADKTLSPIAIGDSLAQGMRDANQLPGISRVGAGPKEVYEMLERFAASNSLSGRDVFLGTGMPNIPEQKKFIEQQIDFVRKQGGNPILIGVGPGTKSKPTTGQNEFLAGLAERKGLTYMGPLVNMFPDVVNDPMGLHLRAPQYKQLFKQFSKSQAQPQSRPQPQQVQPQSSAADLLAQFTGAVMQAESQGKRYDKSGKLLTSPKGAMGEMQVMPGTVRDPGFGVRPARDNSPDELARVGRDYAAVMLRRYNNDPTAAAVAYNWGPGNADRWVKGGADFSVLPKETQDYVKRITNRMGVPIVAKRAPSPAPQRVETPSPKRVQAEEFPLGATLETSPGPRPMDQGRITQADVDRLGPNYQAALAAMTLADTREDDDDFDDDETIAERYMELRERELAREESTLEEEQPVRVSPLASLSEITYSSPFPEEQPVMMAEGGVVRRAEGSPMFGEMIPTGPITEDTRTALANRQGASAAEMMRALTQIGKEGVSNLESFGRGSVAAVPGLVGDIESGFRDDRNRRFATSNEILRNYMTRRLTAPTAEAEGFEELGTFFPPPISPQKLLPIGPAKELISKVRGRLPVKEVDTFPMKGMSAKEVLEQLNTFDPRALEEARKAFLKPSVEKRRMYHGTLMEPTSKMVPDQSLQGMYKFVGGDQGFTTLKPGRGGMTFVTPEPEFADLFAGARFIGSKVGTSPSRVYPVYVQVKKPFDYQNIDHLNEVASEVASAIKNSKKRNELAWWMVSGNKPANKDEILKILKTGEWGFIEDPIVINAVKKLGFDGMYVLEAGIKNLGVFDPKRIKSATGNVGTYDVKVPDIRKAEGGLVERAEGSPIYGEIATGPITEDTRKALRKQEIFNPREVLAALKRIGKEGVSNLESMARGSVAGVPGVVGDIESLFRDDKKRRFATSEEVERQYLPKRFTEPTKEAAGFVELGTLTDPTIALKAAPTTAKTALKMMKESGPQVEAALMKAAPAAQPMYAVKPKGGVFYPQGSGSNIDEYLDRIVQQVARNAPNVPGKDAQKVADFIQNKGRKYLTTTYGTGDDPIREAILEGRLVLTGEDAEKIRGYALRAAREGSPEALKDVEKAYDQLTSLRGNLIIPSKASKLDWREAAGKRLAAQELESSKMAKEGVEEEFRNPSILSAETTDLSKTYATDSEKMLAALLAKERAPVIGAEKTIMTAVEKGEPIYDLNMAYPGFDILNPRTVAQGIATIPVAELERMSFPEAVIRGAQNTLLERSGDAVIAAVEKGNSIPKKFYLEGVTPVKGLENTGWVSLDTPFAVKLEGAAMKHSVSGYAEFGSYGHGGKEALLSGKAKVFSLRPEGGKPAVTVEARVDPEGLYISQIKAPYNSLPTPEEKRKIFELFDTLRPYDFKARKLPEQYSRTRTGETIIEKTPSVNWAEEYSNYLQYKNKGAE